MKSEEKYLLVCYGRSHAKIIKVISDLLPRENIVVLPLLTAKEEFRDREYRKIDLWSYCTDAEIEDAVNIGGEILADHHNPLSGIDEMESLIYLGLSYRDSQKIYGKAKWLKKYSEMGRQGFLPVNTIRLIFSEIQPTALVTTNSPRAERAAQIVASEVCIPSVIFTDLFSGVPYYTMSASYINFLNREAFRSFNRLGLIDRERSTPIFFGNPLFIKMFQALDFDPKQMQSSTSMSKVLHIDSHSYLDCHSRKSVFRTIDEVVAEVDLLREIFGQLGLDLVWRPHPAQISDQLIELVQKKDISIDLTPIDSLDLASFCYIVGRNSTALLELVLRGARLIQIDPHMHGDMPLIEMGLALGQLTTANKKIEIFDYDAAGFRQRVVESLNLQPKNLTRLQNFLLEGLFINA